MNKFYVAGSNSRWQQKGAEPAGFWAGLWHGISLPLVFFFSLYFPTVGLYEINNNGNWYNFGFWIGIVSTSGGASQTG